LITMKVKHSVFINLPAEEIFAYLSDLENLVDWSSVTIAVRKSSLRAIGVGATVRSTIRLLGRWLDITLEVVECEPGRYLTIKSISGVAPCLFYYQFEPVEGGGTAVSQEAVINLTGGFLGQAESVVTSVVRRQLEYDLLTLKDMLEASVATSRSAG
jgi:uncharacterized membrane protein